MNNQDLKKNIFEKIEKREIQKTPRWVFLTKRFLFWGFAGISILFGALVFSILLKNIFSDFGAWYGLENIFIPWKLLILWLLTISIFIAISFWNLRETKKGFKYPWYLILGTSLLTSMLLGTGFYKIHFAEKVENQILHHSHFYKNLKIKHKEDLIKYLNKKNIDPKDFFKNQEIVNLQEKYQKIDNDRVKRLREILEEYKDRDDIDYSKLKILYAKIKEQKKKIDEKRFLKMIEEFKN